MNVVQILNKDLLPSFIGQWLRKQTNGFNLLQPHFKYEIGIYVSYDGDLKIRTPATKIDGVKEICDALLKAAHIIAMKSGLRITMNESEKPKA